LMYTWDSFKNLFIKYKNWNFKNDQKEPRR
jgi:hypothetical protein